MWRNIGDAIVNLRDISIVEFKKEDDKKVVITMDNNRQIVFNNVEGVEAADLYNSIAEMLEVVMERDNSREKERTELLNGILSELKLISQNLRRL